LLNDMFTIIIIYKTTSILPKHKINEYIARHIPSPSGGFLSKTGVDSNTERQNCSVRGERDGDTAVWLCSL